MATRMNEKERGALCDWVALHRCCSVCWWPESDGRRRLEVHHICGGYSRSNGHDPRNYLRLCSQCHGIYHSGKVVGLFPDLNKRILLGVKEECDPDNYDPQYLAQLKRKKHLGYDPEPLPEWYAQERYANLYGHSRS